MCLMVCFVLQVSFPQNESVALLPSKVVAQLKHVLFACNASMTTFSEAWHHLQEVDAV